MHTVEFVTFKASTSFLENPENAIANAIKWLAKKEGFISAYYGVEINDTSVGHIVVIWQTFEHHDVLMKRADYSELLDLIRPCLTAPFVMQHVSCTTPHAAFESSVTELGLFELKDARKRDEFEYGIRILASEVNKKCHAPCICNEVRESPGTYILAIGWDSKKDQEETLGSEKLRKIINRLSDLANVSVVHVDFTKFPVWSWVEAVYLAAWVL